ncbi:MAG: 30S ribosomal protein THX [Candidatus Cloacimonetes bacterium]|nr:30S ribosomal protein THX [Candidatus Cloacimonadota bacterium]
MGKGDRKSRKGKIFRASYGKTRPKANNKKKK